MAAIDIVDLRTVINEADSTTGWNSGDLFTENPDPVEETGHLGIVVSGTPATGWLYFTMGSAVDMSAGVLVYVWTFHRAIVDTRANGGIMLLLGDGSNRVGYHIGGSDISPFRHDTGVVGYMCMVLDTGLLSSYSATVENGTRAGLEGNLANITQVGIGYRVLAKAVGGATNCFVDIMRYGGLSKADPRGISIVDGTSPDPAATFFGAAQLDRSSANQRAYGIIRELGTDVYGIQGEIRIGRDSGAGGTRFVEKNVTAVFESRGLDTDQYRFIVQAGDDPTDFELGTKVGTGSSATGTDGVALVVPPGVGGLFDASGAGTLNVKMYGGRLVGWTGGVKFKEGQEVIGYVFADCGTIEASGATMVNNDISASPAAVALLWNSTLNTLSRLDGCSFLSAGTGHAIELGPDTPSEITFANINFSGYGANDTTDAAVFNNSGKAITINIDGGTEPTVRNGTGASTNIEIPDATLTLTGIKEDSKVRILDAGTTNVLGGTNSSTSTFAFPFTPVVTVDIVVHHLDFEYFRLEGVELTGDASIPISQRSDRWYENPE